MTLYSYLQLLCHCTAKALVIVTLVLPLILVVLSTTVLNIRDLFWVPPANPDRRVSFLFGTFCTAGLSISTLGNGWNVLCVQVRYHTIVTSTLNIVRGVDGTIKADYP